MAIHIIEEDRTLEHIKASLLRAWLKHVIEVLGHKTGVVNFILCSDEYLVGINRQFLKHDYLTDVISFDYSIKEAISGDIFLSIDRIKENAADRQILFPDELKRVMVHGLLHLAGFKDDNRESKAEMTKMEDLFLHRYRSDGKYGKENGE